jgi:myosin heavy subunit
MNIGDRVWAPHKDHAWLFARVTAIDKDKNVEVDAEPVGKYIVPQAESSKLELAGAHTDQDIDNLVNLDEMSEGAILHHVRKRFNKKIIYTHVGNILVAVNPFEKLDIYGPRDLKRATEEYNNPFPHVFFTASSAYRQLKQNSKNQAVLISGESGAGKTETTKKVLAYLAATAAGNGGVQEGPGIEDQILQSNPLLESLGNAKTLRNDNSSRFGKWMKVDFDRSYKIQGCEIVNYLLEKSRVVTQSKNERNYHIFYFLLAGATPELKASLKLESPENYFYLSQSGCVRIDKVDDAHEFQLVLDAIDILRFGDLAKQQMLAVIASVLHLGNINFVAEGENATSQISPQSQRSLRTAASLLEVDESQLQYCLTHKNVQMGKGSVVAIKLTPDMAIDSRDTLSKALFSNLFDWTIRKVNETLKVGQAPYNIGILDIFGFEVFEMNSFEQLCINYSNEKLQLHFNEVVFNEEMKMYAEENVPTDKVAFKDNSGCVSLIEGKPYGLLSLLDEECSLGNATDLSYINKVDQTFGKGKKNENLYFAKHKTKAELFAVRHFAGAVEYTVTNFLDKNRDSLSQTTAETMLSSNSDLVRTLFTPVVNPEAESGGGKSKSTSKTLGGQFRGQLIGLVNNLKTAEAHFIRCVKANHLKEPGLLSGTLALRQLRYAGLFEAIRIRKSGYAYRQPHNIFAPYYSLLVDGLTEKLKKNAISSAEASILILERATANRLFPHEAWHVGKTKVFIKTNDMNVLLDYQKSRLSVKYVVSIQALMRGCLLRMKIFAAKYEKEKLIRAQKAEEEKERKRLLLLKAKQIKAAVVIQKVVRRLLAKRAMISMKDLLCLRKAIMQKDTKKMIQSIVNLDASKINLEKLMPNFQNEVTIARAMLKLVSMQDQLVKQMETAVKNNDTELIRYLIKNSEKIDMSSHPIIDMGRKTLRQLVQKKEIMKKIVEFLQNENEHFSIMPDLLATAKELGVDPDYVAKARRIYEAAEPRLEARYRLRKAIETVDKDSIIIALRDVEDLQRFQPRFGETEIRAGRNMLYLIALEEQLEGHLPTSSGSKSSTTTADTDGPRLTAEMLKLCHELCATEDTSERKALRNALKDLTSSSQHFETVVRAFKWSKTLCVWMYPEVLCSKIFNTYPTNPEDEDIFYYSNAFSSPKSHHPSSSSSSSITTSSKANDFYSISEERGDFFGLRTIEARSSLHITRSLHRDIDLTTGEAPPIVQAALGAMSLQATMQQMIKSIDTSSDLDDEDDNEGDQSFAMSRSQLKSVSTVNRQPTKKKKVINIYI